MLVVDTDLWQPADRVERWREEFGRSVIRAEVEALGERSEQFGVRMAMIHGATLSSLDMRLRAVRKTRDRIWFSDGADSLTFMMCLSGNVRFDTNGVRHVLRRGEAALFSHVVPVDLEWTEARIVTLQVPRAALRGLGDPERLAGRILSRPDRTRALLQVYLAELWRQGGSLSSLAEQQLVELIVEALAGSVPTGAAAPTGRETSARLTTLRALIRRHCTEPFGIADAGRRLGVSARTLERNLQDVGTSFADELTLARLDAALGQLAGTASISDVAFACGFGDISNFNRRFKARFGHTPSEERRRVRLEREDTVKLDALTGPCSEPG